MKWEYTSPNDPLFMDFWLTDFHNYTVLVMKLLYPFAKRYIAGDDFESAQATANRLITNNYEISFNYVGNIAQPLKKPGKLKINILKYSIITKMKK